MPSKSQSIAIGVGVSVVLGLLFGFLATSGGQAGQMIGGCGACLVALLAPMAAVWHYTSTYNLTIPAGQGAGMGAAVGAIGGIVGGLLQRLLISLSIFPDPIENARQQLVSQGLDPAQIEQSLKIAETLNSPVIGLVAGLLIGALIGAIGGVLGAVIFKKGSEVDDFDV